MLENYDRGNDDGDNEVDDSDYSTETSSSNSNGAMSSSATSNDSDTNELSDDQVTEAVPANSNRMNVQIRIDLDGATHGATHVDLLPVPIEPLGAVPKLQVLLFPITWVPTTCCFLE